MKIYYGVQTGVGGQVIWVIDVNTMTKTSLPHICLHSPDGFQWGYGGSGPADTAFNILLDAVGKAKAERWYQSFKHAFIVPASDVLCVPEAAIKEWLRIEERKEADGS